MDYVSMFTAVVGGLGMFLYGMHIMASGLQKCAGNKLKHILEILTRNKLMGILLGAIVTAIIQSSSATTVMVVGFVNAGIMDLTQTVGIIMGANIGTTVTGWLVSSVEWASFLKPEVFAPVAIALGAFMMLFTKKNFTALLGETIAGFGLLFVGISMMSGGLEPLQELPAFANAMSTFGDNPIMGVLVGTVITAIIQSSSASVAILQSLAIVGLVRWDAAVYIIMGENIGTCATAIISSIGTSKNAKAAAYIHLIFNIVGAVIVTAAAVIYFGFVDPVMGKNMVSSTEISLIHTAANIAKEGTDTYGLYYINYVNSSPEINRITDFTAVDNEVPVFAFDYLNLTGLVTYNNNELTVYTSYGDSWNKVITQPISGDVSSMDLDACYNKLVISGGDLGNMVKYIDLAKETSTDILIDTENTPLNGITKIAMTEDSLYIALYDTQDNSIDIYRESLPSEKIGDVDRNGIYTSNDAALALSYVLKNVDSGLDEEQIRLAGVCGGTHMTANDAAYILARSLDNSIVFPVEKY